MHDPIALIALDLDGTLLRSDTTVSDRTLGAIDACRTQGLHIAIATARPFASVQRLLPASLHRDVPWICGSGGSVYENAVCLYQDLLDVATAQAVVEVLYRAEEDFIVALEMAGRLYVNRPVAGLLTPHQVCDLRTIVTAPVAKFLVHALDDPSSRRVPVGAMAPAANLCLPALPVGCQVQVTDHGSRANILAPTVSKAQALQCVLAQRGLDFGQVMAFGDDISDREMLVQSAIGVAMANAVAEILAIAARVTASNDEEGVALVLEELVGRKCMYDQVDAASYRLR
jgi:hydroxymethylpyrimidine pyrophosphatase-like HAD family hydrolase